METTKIPKVLIALDYNPTAQKVAEVGYAMANSMNAEITLIHVITDPVYYSSTVYSPIMGFNGFTEKDPLQLDISKTLEKTSLVFLEKTKQHLKNDNIKTLVIEGDYAEAILMTAKKLNIDIIVMGSHCYRWLEEKAMECVMEKVLNHTTIPIFIVPTKQILN